MPWRKNMDPCWSRWIDTILSLHRLVRSCDPMYHVTGHVEPINFIMSRRHFWPPHIVKMLTSSLDPSSLFFPAHEYAWSTLLDRDLHSRHACRWVPKINEWRRHLTWISRCGDRQCDGDANRPSEITSERPRVVLTARIRKNARRTCWTFQGLSGYCDLLILPSSR